jgi:predicted nucleic acid-binding protein
LTWRVNTPARTLTVTFAEIRYGIELLDDPARRATLTHWLDHQLRPVFAGRTLPLCEDTLLAWRLIIESGHRRGHTFSHPDVLIAASAARHSLTVVTGNTDAFDRTGVAVVDPWQTPKREPPGRHRGV